MRPVFCAQGCALQMDFEEGRTSVRPYELGNVMSYHPDIHHRQTIRLRDFDYAGGGYFVTLCAWQRECLFGDAIDGGVRLNEWGTVAGDEWLRTPMIRPNVVLDEFVVMPNHFHAIIFINDVGAHRCAPESVGRGKPGAHIGAETRAHIGAPLRRQPGSLGSIIAGFKSAVTKRINEMRDNLGCPVWQRNYYEHVIRDDRDLHAIRQYIADNPAKWELDDNHPTRL